MNVCITILNQDVSWADSGVVALLVLLEGVLSIDNALVLGLLARRLPHHQQSRALTYGLLGAFVFRIAAVTTASFLLQWRIVKLLGGAYLVYIAVKHLWFDSHDGPGGTAAVGPKGELTFVNDTTGEALTPEQERVELDERVPMLLREDDVSTDRPRRSPRFWPTVLVIELTDIAFAVDSILAAIALVGGTPAGHPPEAAHPKLWVVITGGLLGVILMRFAAVLFIRLLERFPRFELAAYLLVTLIGLKLLGDWGFNTPANPHRLNFHDYHHPEFWAFWALMVICFCVGFLPTRRRPAPKSTQSSDTTG